MIQIHENLYVGSDADVDEFKELHPDGYIIHAAKEPWHRKACGYTGRAAPKGDDYFFRYTTNALALNLVDSPDKKYIAEECFKEANDILDFMYEKGRPVLLHCNQGKSRSAGILFYHMMQVDIEGFGLSPTTFDEALEFFTETIYPDTVFGNGVHGFLEEQYNLILDGEDQ